MSTRNPLVALLAVGLLMAVAGLAHAASLITDVESAVGGATYLDIVNMSEGFTRGGLTAKWTNYTAGDWGWPDTSDSGVTVDGDGDGQGDVADSKSNNSPEIQMDFTGLAANAPGL